MQKLDFRIINLFFDIKLSILPWGDLQVQMGPTIKIISKSRFGQKFGNVAYSENLSIRRAPREAKNLGIFTLTIRLSSNFVKIHTSGVNRINIWVLRPGDTAKNSKRHGLRF